MDVKKYFFLCVFVLFIGGCTIAPVTPFYRPALNPPQYLYDSGILQLQRTLHLPSYEDGANLMYFSNDGRYLATSGMKSHHIHFWDLRTGKIIYSAVRFRKDESGRKKTLLSWRVTFLPDNRKVLLYKRSSKNQLKEPYREHVLLDLKDGSVQPFVISRNVSTRSLRFSPDGKYVASLGATSLKGHDDYGKQQILQIINADDWSPVSPGAIGGFAAQNFRFTPDGKYIVDHECVGDESPPYEMIDGAFAQNYNGQEEKYLYPEIRFWSVPDLKLVRTIDNVFKSSAQNYIAISPDGRYVAVAGQDHLFAGSKIQVHVAVRVFGIDTGQLEHELPEVHGDLDFSKNNRYLIVGSGQEHMAIRIYDTKEWKLLEQVKFADSFWALDSAISPDGSTLALSNGLAVYVWNIKE